MSAYETLGVKPGCSNKTAKKAYRKLSMRHHPDRGGDKLTFQNIKQAYEDIVSGKATFEEEVVQGPTGEDFKNYFHKRRRANQYIRIDAKISLHNAFHGGKRVITVQTMAQRDPVTVQIDIPVGVQDREEVRYRNGLVDGIDLVVTYLIQDDAIWKQKGYDLYKKEEFSIWDLINGCTRDISTIADGTLRLKVPPMSQPGSHIRIRSMGARTRENYLNKGDLFVELVAVIPKDIPEDLLLQIKEL